MPLNKLETPSDDPGGEHYLGEVNLHYWLQKRNDIKAIKKTLENIAGSSTSLLDDSVICENSCDKIGSVAYSDNSMIVHAEHSYASYSIHADHDYHKILDANEGIENNFLGGSRENLCLLQTRSNCNDSVVERKKEWLKINIEHQYTKSLFKNNNSINKRKFSRKLLHPLLGLRNNQLFNKKVANYSKNSIPGHKKINSKISKIIRSRSIRKIKNKYKLVNNFKVNKFRKKFFNRKSELVSVLAVEEHGNVDSSNKGIFEKESITNRNVLSDIQPSDFIANIKLNSIKEKNNENYLSTDQLNAFNNDIHLTLKNTNNLSTPSLSNKLIENSFSIISPKRRLTLSNIFLDHSYSYKPENRPSMDNSDKNDYGDLYNISSIIDIERLYKILNLNCMNSSNFKPFVVKAKNHRFLFQKSKSTGKDASLSLTNNIDANLTCSLLSSDNGDSMRKTGSTFNANNNSKTDIIHVDVSMSLSQDDNAGKIQSTDNYCGYKRKGTASPETNIITKKLKSVSSPQTQKCLSDKKEIMFTDDENMSLSYLPNVDTDSTKNCSAAEKNSLNGNGGSESKIVIENVISLASPNNDNYIDSPPKNINNCELKQALTRSNAVSKILKPVINYDTFSGSGSRDQVNNLPTLKNTSVDGSRPSIRVRRDIFKSVTPCVSNDSFPTVSGTKEGQTEERKLEKRDEERSLYCSEHFDDDEETLSSPENGNDGNITIEKPQNFYGLFTSESKDLETELCSSILDRAMEQRHNHSCRIRLEHNYNEAVTSQNPATLDVTSNLEYSKNKDAPFKRHKKSIVYLGTPLHNNKNLNYSGKENLKSSLSEHLSKKLNDICPFDCFVKLERIDFCSKLNLVNDDVNYKSLKSSTSQNAVSSTNNPSSSVKKSNISSKALPKQIVCVDKQKNRTNNGKYVFHFNKNLNNFNSYQYKSHGSSNQCKMKPTCQQRCTVNSLKEPGETTLDSSQITQTNKHTENMKSLSSNSKMKQHCLNNPAVVLLKHRMDTLAMKRSVETMMDFGLVSPNSVTISPTSNGKKSCVVSLDGTENFHNLASEIKLCSVRVNRCDISKYGCVCSSQPQDNGNNEINVGVSGKIIDVKNQKHSCVSQCKSSRQCMPKHVHSIGTIANASEAEMKTNDALSNEVPPFERINISDFSKNECSSILRRLQTRSIATQCDEHDIKKLLDRARRYTCIKAKTLSDPKPVKNFKSAAKVKRKNPEVRLSDIYKQLQFLSYFDLKLCTSEDMQNKKLVIKNRLCTVNKNYKV